MADRQSITRRPIPLKGATVAYTGTASTAAVAPANATSVFVWLTTDGYVSLGPASVATTSDMPLPAYTPIYLDCQTGDNLSAIRDTVSGNLKYSWMT